MKKFFAAAALFAAMVMASCSAPTTDSIVEDVNACKTVEDLKKINDDEDIKEAIKNMTPEDKKKVADAVAKKKEELGIAQPKAAGK